MRPLLGAAKVDITPRTPVPLAGFAFRRGRAEGVHAPLYLKVLSFGYQDGRRLIVLAADLLWWGNDTVEECRALLAAEPALKGSEFLFLATHTHCGPQVSRCFASGLGEPDSDYVAFLQGRVLEACREAVGSEEPVCAFLRRGKTSIAVNRRLPTSEGIAMRPNPLGDRDPTLTLVDFVRADGTLKARLAHGVCHLTSSADNRVSSEFAGMATELWSRDLPGTPPVVFVQGFCGDVRPALVREGAFFRGGLDAETGELARCFLEELRATENCEPSSVDLLCELRREIQTIALPLAAAFPHRKYDAWRGEEGAVGEWARHWNARGPAPRTLEVRVSTWRMGERLTLLFVNAEVVGRYAERLAAGAGTALLCCGYADGMTTYLPTARQLREGGYEAYDAMFYFLTPAPFAPEAEEVFIEAVAGMLP